ncbi:MAG: hypothetical protein HYZ75_18120 [Elusimicrobia bacterium]|nr:hypothetical protein [Elusimicrobiota bacterium]
MTSLKKPLAGALAFSLAGCGMLNKTAKLPTYDANATPQSQASVFIGAQNTNLLTNKKAFVSECNVIVGFQTGASAGTTAGLLSNQGGRADSKVISMYYLKGITDEQLQALTDAVCADAEARLGSSGYSVVPQAQLQANPLFQKLNANGKASPFDWGVGKNKYKVYAAKGSTVYNPKYLGAGGGLAMAMKQASGNAPAFMEANLVDELGADAVRLNVVLDFSSVQGDGHGKWIKKDSASVKGKVLFAVSGSVTVVPKDGVTCSKRFGNRECYTPKKLAALNLKYPVTTEDKFYTEIKDATTTGDKVAAVATKAIALLGALAGSTGSSSSTKRTDVNIDAPAYDSVAKKQVGNFIDMALAAAKGS